jgi:anti-sigma-K factor RskA
MASDHLSHEALGDLAELAALEVLSAKEARRLAEHVEAGCEECAARMARGLEAFGVLALAGPVLAASPGGRQALLDAIPAPRSPARQRAEARWRRWQGVLPAVAAGIAALVATAAWVVGLRLVDERVEQARLELARLDARIESTIDERLAARDERMETFAATLAHFEDRLRESEGARSLTLVGEAAFRGASARVVVDPAGNQVLLLASRLPPAPPGHTYQLWVIVSGAPSSLGVFDPDVGGRAIHVESESLHLEGEYSVAISVEPAGGVPQPTGPIVLASH